MLFIPLIIQSKIITTNTSSTKFFLFMQGFRQSEGSFLVFAMHDSENSFGSVLPKSQPLREGAALHPFFVTTLKRSHMLQ